MICHWYIRSETFRSINMCFEVCSEIVQKLELSKDSPKQECPNKPCYQPLSPAPIGLPPNYCFQSKIHFHVLFHFQRRWRELAGSPSPMAFYSSFPLFFRALPRHPCQVRRFCEPFVTHTLVWTVFAHLVWQLLGQQCAKFRTGVWFHIKAKSIMPPSASLQSIECVCVCVCVEGGRGKVTRQVIVEAQTMYGAKTFTPVSFRTANEGLNVGIHSWTTSKFCLLVESNTRKKDVSFIVEVGTHVRNINRTITLNAVVVGYDVKVKRIQTRKELNA